MSNEIKKLTPQKGDVWLEIGGYVVKILAIHEDYFWRQIIGLSEDSRITEKDSEFMENTGSQPLFTLWYPTERNGKPIDWTEYEYRYYPQHVRDELEKARDDGYVIEYFSRTKREWIRLEKEPVWAGSCRYRATDRKREPENTPKEKVPWQYEDYLEYFKEHGFKPLKAKGGALIVFNYTEEMAWHVDYHGDVEQLTYEELAEHFTLLDGTELYR